MAFTEYTTDTAVIAALGTTADERGLTTAQFKAKFDEAITAFVAWFNDTHLAEIPANLPVKGLSDNSDFRAGCLVNQRGAASYGNGYGIDRWILFSSDEAATITVNSGYIALSSNADGLLVQYMEEARMTHLLGETLTLSLQKSDGTIISGSVTLPAALPETYTAYSAYSSEGIGFYASLGPTGTASHFRIFGITNNSGSPLNIVRVKAEVGSTSTLVNDPPLNYGEQLAICQRYYQKIVGSGTSYTRFGIGQAKSTTQADIPFFFQTVMRIAPTLASSGTIGLTAADGTNLTISTLAQSQTVTKSAVLTATVSSGLAAGNATQLSANGDESAYIAFSADL